MMVWNLESTERISMRTVQGGDVTEGSETSSNLGAATSQGPWNDHCKAAADTAVAFLFLLVAAPLIGILMALVKATSRGPAIYKQLRLGRGGQPYYILKLRTMAHDCERLTGPQWSKSKDPRVTRFGRFLRRSHLDELPQLWNVIQGDMSLVGPRPERPEFVTKLQREIPNYRMRMAIRPGITGLAQVQLPPDESTDDVRRKVQCDLCYVRQMGAWLDFKILMATVFKVMGVPFDTIRAVLNLPGLDRPSSDAQDLILADSGSLQTLRT